MVLADPTLSLTASILAISALVAKGMPWILAFGLDFDDLSRTASIIQEIVTRANEEQIRATQNWLLDFQDAFCDLQDLRDTTEIPEYLRGGNPFCSIRTWCKIKKMKDRFHQLRKRAQFIQTLVVNEGACSPGLSSTASHVDIATIFGRDNAKEEIIKMLFSTAYRRDGCVTVSRIVGMTGVGKTTLAQIVYNDDRVREHFDRTMWVCVNHDFDHSRILREMMVSDSQKINYTSSSQNQLYEEFLKFVGEKKRVLLVLDGVRTFNNGDWNKLLYLLKMGEIESSVLVTSQRSDVCSAMGMGVQNVYTLDPLNDSGSWALFQQSAFTQGNCPPELESFGREIVGKCKGLPLAVKAMGGLLQNNLDARKWRKISQLDVCEAEKVCRSEKPNILPMLKVSYNHLPSYLKPLFSYCSLLPKGHSFNQKELAQFWMAESLIQPQGQETMEETASEHFDDLLMRSFFHRISPHNKSQDYNYMMHDLYHELARYISSPYCCPVEDSKKHNFSAKIRHISLGCRDVEEVVFDVEEAVLEIIDKCKKVRTLLFPNYHLKKEFGQALDKMFKSLKYMRVLDLSSSTILELPKSVKELKLLRYLNLSKTEIKRLPDSICKLFYLQTLKLLECPQFSQLPQNLAKLINLRHLELDEEFWCKTTKLPPRIGSLTSLHTLYKFPIRRKVGYGIEELEGMSYLTGMLYISKLENAVNAGEAKLNKKESLRKLVLEWSSGDDALQDEAAQLRVLEDLRPHSDLKELQIFNFRGTVFPLWMTEGQLQNLVTVSLKFCTRCRVLSLGGLPHLEKINIKGMQELEELQELGEYPSLVFLKISYCRKLMKLPSHFPNLEDLKIKDCDSLKTLAVTPLLKVLVLDDNLVLEDLNEVDHSFSSLLELKINGCPKLKALPQICTPKKVEIGGCNLLEALSARDYSQQLEHLILDECEDETLVVGAIPRSTSLNSLVISNISKATCFPKWPHLPGLKALHIRHCKDLVALSQEASPFQDLTSLKLLSIQGCPKLVKLPREGLPTTLECLTLSYCTNLESLGPNDVLKSLTSLKGLHIKHCPNVHSLPEDGVSTSLQHLVIEGCPTLREQFRPDGGLDWPKIMRIPHIEIDSTQVSPSLDLSNQVQGHPKASSTRWYHHLMPRKGGKIEGKHPAEASNSAEHRPNVKRKGPPEPSSLGERRQTFDKGTIELPNLVKHERNFEKERLEPSNLLEHERTFDNEMAEPSNLEEHGRTFDEEKQEPSNLGEHEITFSKEMLEPSDLAEHVEYAQLERTFDQEMLEPSDVAKHERNFYKETLAPSDLVEHGRTFDEEKQEPSNLGEHEITFSKEMLEPSDLAEHVEYAQLERTFDQEMLEPSDLAKHERNFYKETLAPSDLVEHGRTFDEEKQEPSNLGEHEITFSKEMLEPSDLAEHVEYAQLERTFDPEMLEPSDLAKHERNFYKETLAPSDLVEHEGTFDEEKKEPSNLGEHGANSKMEESPGEPSREPSSSPLQYYKRMEPGESSNLAENRG
ncbi:putative disease resistance protein RGA3 isoform X3 [Vitis vinifera]|uniref:putative disease resistance protein RGA3 isoform X3 n=1 Tax=Vitis vinifera TaxID=29760 RepID=UPI002882D4F9|nr:putative disease resistance protein RGA3 isoform X3 [Vitis vinifera]